MHYLCERLAKAFYSVFEFRCIYDTKVIKTAMINNQGDYMASSW